MTKWTRTHNKRLARLISCIHHTSDYRQCCHVGNAAQHCQFKQTLQEILNTQNPHQAETCAFLEVEKFVPISLMCKKQTSVFHSSTEPEVISLDAGLRMDGFLALDLWNLVIEVLGTTHRIPKPTQACTRETGVEIQSTPKITQVLDQNVDLSNTDQVPSNAHLF